MTLISAIILLGILIFVHELGHFLFAKLLNVKVEKFSLGFGPRVVSKKFGETEYLVSALPLGGYVKMLGEHPEEDRELSEEDKKRAFNHQSVLRRFLIVFSGPVFNIAFAAVVFVFIFLAGVPFLMPEVGEVMEDTPAMRAGLKQGDRIIKIGNVEVSAWSEMTGVIHNRPGEELDFRIEREGEVLELSITPDRKTVQNIFGEDEEIGLIGIKPSGEQGTRKYGLTRAVPMAVVRTIDIIGLTMIAFGKLITRVIPADSLGGPIMIFSMAGEQASAGARNFFGFMAFISINLGIINLFPIPVLDGGHILFLAIESLRKKPLSEKALMAAQRVGLAIIITLIVFVVYNDIMRIITGKGFP
jgi:regulator of sigma E protease